MRSDWVAERVDAEAVSGTREEWGGGGGLAVGFRVATGEGEPLFHGLPDFLCLSCVLSIQAGIEDDREKQEALQR